MLLVGLLMLHTYDALSKGGPHQSSQSEVTYLDRSCRACYEDVVALEVSVDNWRSSGVKEVKALQNLSTPTPQYLGFHHLKALKVTVERANAVKIKENTVLDD